MSKKCRVIETVLSQKSPFYSSTITSLSGSSVALVSNTLNELLSEGKINSQREGKKIKYFLSDNENNRQMSVVVEPICTIADKFQYIRDLVDMVIKGIQPSIMITGQSGVGKSYIVKNQLKRAGLVPNIDYISASGHSSPFGLFKVLHDNRDATIVLDDIDSIFHNDTCTNILKAALDSYAVRRVSWYSDRAAQQELDSVFEFTGRIIFISNMYAEKIDSAIRSRAFCFDLKMSNDEISEHMGNILGDIEKDKPIDIRLEVWEYLKTIQNEFKNYSLRILIQAIRIRFYCLGTDKNWKQMIRVLAQDV